ncbi:unnamed protein product [Prorocentrum cordatum]|uniref:GOLD domain-containing protein n=1 Tax=Prorocentrum cordatum TaxID=2364126 RepID=A0ABN9VCD0_9DINO|nr:unnamed protein product [Polarella glacialis]
MRLPRRAGLAWLLGPLLAGLRAAGAIKLTVTVPGNEKKCFGEQAAKQELLVCEIEAHGNKKVSMRVTSPQATVFSDHDREKIKTAFTTTEAGAHWMCIQNEDSEPTDVTITIAVGAEAKDYSQIAKKEHLEDTAVLLRKIEENLKNYHKNVLYIRKREERMRKTNDSTAFRVICFCVFNVALMIAVGGWQMLYFKRFFRSKKII